VKPEDLDWMIYHLLLRNPDIGEEDLSFHSNASQDEIRASLQRLFSANLLERKDDGFRIVSIQEMILRCQAKYDKKCRFLIENGVIKVKFDSGPKDD